MRKIAIFFVIIVLALCSSAMATGDSGNANSQHEFKFPGFFGSGPYTSSDQANNLFCWFRVRQADNGNMLVAPANPLECAINFGQLLIGWKNNFRNAMEWIDEVNVFVLCALFLIPILILELCYFRPKKK